MNFASLSIALLVLVGCSSQVPRPATSPLAAAPSPAPSANKVVELRHIYLLSPGPNATLVVTRSDVPGASQ